MAEYLSPGVYVEEFDSGATPMQGAGTSTAGFLGLAEKGPIAGSPVLVTNPSDFVRKFGGYLSESQFGEYRYLAYAVNSFFANGGGRAFVMRVVPPDAKYAMSVAEDGKDALSFEAVNPGKWGNSISVNFEPSSKAKTQILDDLGGGAYQVKNASGFNPGDVVTVNGLDDAQYQVISSVDEDIIVFENAFDGDIVDVDLLPKVTISTCEMNVVVKCGDVQEEYATVSFNVSSSNYIEKKMSKSNLVIVTAKPQNSAVAPIEIAKDNFGVSKDSFRVSLKNGSDGTLDALSDADYIGEDKGPGARTGLQAFIDNNDVSLMAVPGVVSPNVQLSLVAHCESLGSRFAVLDIPRDSKTVTDVMKHRGIVDSDYCAMYHPWLKTFDPLDKKDIYIPPSGAVLGIYARSDSTRGVHKAPANEVVANCTGLYCNYNTGEQDMLNPKGVNLIRKFPGSGIRVWGARTASSKPLWKYVNVRRLFIYIEETIKANTSWVVFEPNDELLWVRVQRTIINFLEGVWRSGALVGSSADQAFFVDIGPSTMSQDDIDNGRLVCVIGVAPVKPAEFVVFRLTQKTGE
jgi:phage tail sheath protein FI